MRRAWCWAAAILSLALPGMLVRAMVLTTRQANQSMPDPSDGPDSGLVAAGYWIEILALGFGLLVCLVFPALWAATAVVARRDVRRVRAPAVCLTVFQGLVSVATLGLGSSLFDGWADVTALILAEAMAVVATVVVCVQKDGGRFARKAATPSAYSGDRTASS